MLSVRHTTLAKLLRQAGEFLLNLVVAAVFTSVLRADFRLHRGRSSAAFLIVEYAINAAIAFALGYFVYRGWRLESAKSVWAVGLCLFAQRAIRFRLEQHGPLNAIHGSTSLYWEMSGVGCLVDRSICSDRVYTLILLRTAFYSCGAWFCMWFRQRESAALPNLMKAILALRRT